MCFIQPLSPCDAHKNSTQRTNFSLNRQHVLRGVCLSDYVYAVTVSANNKNVLATKICAFSIFYAIYTVNQKKQDIKLLLVTSLNINRFSNLLR